MRTTIQFTLLGALAATAACTTNNTTTTTATPSANAVIPSSGFIGRQLRVEISGDNTAWSAATTVDFGAGVTVGTVTVASPTDLFADITIAPTATSGLHDVKVTDTATGDVTLTQAFELDNPITVEVQGTLAQGSIVGVTITNHDFDTPFAATADLTVTAGSGVTFNLGTTNEYTISATALIDTDAASGPIQVVSGAGATSVTSPGDALTIAPRTAMALTAGTAVNGTIAKPLDSGLYSFSAGAAPVFLTMAASTTDANAAPSAIILPASGHFADLVGNGPSVSLVTAANDKFFIIYWDNTGTSGYQYAVKASAVTPASNLAEVEPNDTKATAQATTTFPALFTGTIKDDVDADWIKVVIPTGAAKKIHVITTSPGNVADSEILFMGTDGTTVLDDVDSGFGEDASTAALPAGTYWVQITPSQFALQLLGYVPADDPYQALITLE